MANFREDYPSYKTPGVYPSGSDISVGLDNTNLLNDSLGNWNTIVRDSDSDGNSRVFISFASDSELITPTVNENEEAVTQGRPIYFKITENLLKNGGFTSIICKGIQRDDWYQEGDSGFNNRRRYKRMRGEIKKVLSDFDTTTFGQVNIGDESFDFRKMYSYPREISESFFYDTDYTPSSNDPNQPTTIQGATPELIIHFHELMNRYKEVIKHYWNVDSSTINQFIDQTWDFFRAGSDGFSDTEALWNEMIGGNFRTGLFNNPTSLTAPLSFLSQNSGFILRENEAPGEVPDDWKIINEDDLNLNDITFKMPTRPLELDDAWFIPEVDQYGMHIDSVYGANDETWQSLYNKYYRGELDYLPFGGNVTGDNIEQATEILYFPSRIVLKNPSDILDTSATEFSVSVLEFPVFTTEEPPIENIVINNWNEVDLPSAGKLGYPYFSYDYIFGGEDAQGSLFGNNTDVPLTATEVDNFVVDCYVNSENKTIPLKYYQVGTEEYRSTSYPLNINLNITLLDSEIEYTDPFGSGFGRASVYELLNLLYGSVDYVQARLNNLASPPFHYRYQVVQWGDEDSPLTDEQIESSYYFKMYDVENYPPDTDSYEYKKFVQSHVNSNPINSITNHVYSSPGVKNIKIVVYKMSSNGVFVLQSYLIHKNIMVSDGNLSAQDFAIFGIGDFKFLPIKNNQVVIGSLTSDSFYNQSISKLVKDNNFTKEDYPEKVSSVKYLSTFNNELLGEGLAQIDLGQTRMYNKPKDIYSFIGGNKVEIINKGSGSLPTNSSATDIFIKDDNCIVDLNPANHEFFAIRNQIGGKGQGVIVGDYRLTQPPAGRVRREGDMNRPEIVTEKNRQAF